MTDLMKYLPDYWQDIVEMNAIQTSVSPELDKQKYAITDLLNQCFISTATWGLALWERELAIVINDGLSYDARRAALLAKLQGTATTTVAMIKALAETCTGGIVNVIEHNEIYIFEVFFLKPLGIPPNMQVLINALEESKPAHLGYKFRYRYTNWGEIKPYKWGELLQRTWEGVRIFEEASL